MNERDIFIAAMQLDDPAERQAYLAEACGTDGGLRREVEGLLAVCASAESFLESPPPGLSAPADNVLREGPGTVIGPYQLLQQIGEGGMGVVFMAEQEEPVRRKVALKIIKPGMDSAGIIARFEAERQALALMDHPNIARVFDAGTVRSRQSAVGSQEVLPTSQSTANCQLPTGEGRPYFAMELVKGAPVTEYCDQHHLTPRERLELFVPVCQAVQHAHAKGIIHRDLKPSNVLVTRYDSRPVPKIIDFGVAKAVGLKLTERTLFTEFGAIVGTLEYMSPEQAELNQLDVDTRSDIYALGVLLYELLTGTTPLQSKRVEEPGFWELLRLIREGETQRPSTRLSTAEDLPTIAANRGMDPGKLGGLVRGELDWIVMKALEKDRNRRYETANALALDLQRYLAGEAVQACPPSSWYRLRKFARRHQVGLAFAGLLLLFLVALGGGLGWAIGDRAARQHVQHDEADNALRRAVRTLEQGKYAEAAAWVERAEGVLAGGQEHPALQPRLQAIRADLDMVAELKEIRIRQSDVQNERLDLLSADPAFAQAFRRYGIDVESLQVEAAATAIRARPIALELVLALDDWADLRQQHPANTKGWQHFLAVAQAADGDDLRNQLRQALAQTPADLPALKRLAASDNLTKVPAPTLVLLARLLRGSGAFEQAVAVLRQAQRRYPNDFWVNHDLGYCLVRTQPPRWQEALPFYTTALGLWPESPGVRVNLARVLNETGDYHGAIAVLEEAIYRRPDNATAYNSRGFAYNRLGQPDKALTDFNQAIKLKPAYALPWNNRGNSHVNLGQPAKAIADYSRAIRLDPNYVKALNNRANLYRDLGQLDKAAADYSKVLDLKQDDAETWNNRGTVYHALGQFTSAIADLTRAIQLKPNYAEAWSNRGDAYRKQRPPDLDQALADLDQAIKLEPNFAPAWYNRGIVYRLLERLDDAVADCTRVIQLTPGYAEAWNNRGGIYRMQGKLNEAVTDLDQAIKLKPDLVQALNNRGLVHQQLEQWDRAIADFSKAVSLKPRSPGIHKNLAWLLAACPEAKFRDPRRAVEVAKKVVALAPREAVAWKTLGVAHYRAGDCKASIEALDRSLALQENASRAATEWFFLAMAHARLAHEAEARRWYEKALEWMEKRAPMDAELQRFRTEAAALLKIDN
jgi:tetratricopeptide (TPR) repeat protein